MSAISTAVLAISMSADAFAVSLSKGAGRRTPGLLNALKAGAVFGLVEGLMPIIGWLLGVAASGFIASVDHWIAFLLLAGVGLKMIHEGLQDVQEVESKPAPGLRRTLVTAFATSIDAMAVGVTLAFVNMNIWVSAAAIGFATFIMVTIGMLVGHVVGSRLGKYAEIGAGVAVMLVGTGILCEHMGWLV